MTADRVTIAIDRSDLAERTVQEAQIALGAVFREAAIDTPTLDARLLIAAACGIEPADVITQGERRITPAEESRLLAFAERRLAREPVARILGYRHFHGLRLDISPATLDPRPETETLVDGVLDLIKKGEAPGGSTPRLLDAGTGSGAILIALLHALPGATGVGVDCSAAALAVAQRNAHLTSVGDRAAFLVSDWLAEVRGEFDIIVANPPYIPTSDIAGLDAEVVRYDPLCALDGGTDGLAPYRRLIPQAMAHLALGGWLVVETGEDQTAGVADIAKEAGSTEIRVWLDLGRKPRCVAVRHH